ncbi:TRAP transporter substrate-binding protein [Niallia endozanthoxylica]|uniref:TRAP transporter substrate-binding protein n=1 Tax=Niallia endozanthoxylica TaxID=2036016 RepID=A0A5J5I381_9BACI|nr:TRAP transporter substrate-binding protein [Niallia endozanthoxylica]
MNKKFKFALTGILASMLMVSACSSGSTSGESKGDGEVKPIEFKFGSMDSPDHVQNAEAFTTFAEDVKGLTDGRVTFEMYTGGSLGGPKDTLENIKTGIMDVGRGIHGYNAGTFEAQSVMLLPFMADGNAEELSIVTQKLHDQFPEIQEEYSDVKLLWVHAADPYAIITKGKAVRSFKDMKGLKLRTPSTEGSEMIEAWGATPVSIPAPEIYDAMQKGVIDGGILPIAAIKDFNLTDLVDYVTIGNFNTNLFYVSMNKDSWNKISPEDQKLIEEKYLGLPMAKQAGQAFDGQKERAEKEAKDAGAEFITLPEEELTKFKESAQTVTDSWIEKMDKKGIDGQKIYDEAVKLIESK